MFTYQKFLIRDLDRFVPFQFPQLDASLEQVVVHLATAPHGPRKEMFLSFVKDHRINSQQANDHPELAALISSKSMPLHVTEALFESSTKNLVFRKELEDYISTYFDDRKV